MHLHNRESPLLGADARAVVAVDPDGRRWAWQLAARPGAGKRILGAIAGISDRDAARRVQGWRFGVELAALEPCGPDEFYHRDVIGLPVHDDGERIGVVVEVHDGGGAEVFEVKLDAGGSDWVPCTHEQIEAIDLDEGRIVLRPLEDD